MRAVVAVAAFVALFAVAATAAITSRWYSNSACTGAVTEATSFEEGACVLQNTSRNSRGRTTSECNATFARLQVWAEADSTCTGARQGDAVVRVGVCLASGSSGVSWQLVTCSAPSLAAAAVVVVVAAAVVLLF
jgi:hypothetical protein